MARYVVKSVESERTYMEEYIAERPWHAIEAAQRRHPDATWYAIMETTED